MQKGIKKQTTNYLFYVVSCLIAILMDGQVLKILTLLAIDIPNHLNNTIVVINQFAKIKWTKKQHFMFTSNIEVQNIQIASNLICINLTVTCSLNAMKLE